jgi:hypothetical protein
LRPDGCYLGLPFADYLAEGAMGSTKKGTLWLRGEGYYWKYLSPFIRNDDNPEELLFGEACHAALLEGMHSYESRYVVEPAKKDYPDALFTIPKIKAALKDAGVYPARSSTFTKEDWAEAAELYLPDQPVWENVLDEFRRRTGAGRDLKAIDAEADFAIRAMRELAIGEYSTDEMRELFSVGSKFPVLAEVSYFYTDETGMRHCARFDKLIPPAVGDLKTLGGWRGKPLASYVDRHIKDFAYDVQCADYQIARQHMMAAILEDESIIHGATDEERDHLIAMAHYDQAHHPSFAWVFFQKPTAAGIPPVLFPVIEPWKGPYHLAGFRKRAAALATYRDCMERFGPDRPWGRAEPVHTTVEHKTAPQVHMNEFGWGPEDEAPGERDHFGD